MDISRIIRLRAEGEERERETERELSNVLLTKFTHQQSASFKNGSFSRVCHNRFSAPSIIYDFETVERNYKKGAKKLKRQKYTSLRFFCKNQFCLYKHV